MRAFWILCTCQNHNKKCSRLKWFIFVSCIILIYYIYAILYTPITCFLWKCYFLYKSPVKSHQAITLNPFRACSLNSATQMKTVETQTNKHTYWRPREFDTRASLISEWKYWIFAHWRFLRGHGEACDYTFFVSLQADFFAFLFFALINSSTDGVQKADTFLWVTCCGNKVSGI